MGTTSQDIHVYDFFSGCGGTSAGLKAAGLKIVFALDNDPDAAATYRLNLPEVKFFERDIRDLEDLIEELKAGRFRPVDLTLTPPK